MKITLFVGVVVLIISACSETKIRLVGPGEDYRRQSSSSELESSSLGGDASSVEESVPTD